MGEIRTALADLPAPIAPLPAFEAALNRFKKAFEEGLSWVSLVASRLGV